jgi:hypothetical protein
VEADAGEKNTYLRGRSRESGSYHAGAANAANDSERLEPGEIRRALKGCGCGIGEGGAAERLGKRTGGDAYGGGGGGGEGLKPQMHTDTHRYGTTDEHG